MHEIIHERTPPYSPQSNEITERMNRTLTDLVNTILETAGLSKEWWGEAISWLLGFWPVGANALPEAHASFHKKSKTFF